MLLLLLLILDLLPFFSDNGSENLPLLVGNQPGGDYPRGPHSIKNRRVFWKNSDRYFIRDLEVRMEIFNRKSGQKVPEIWE